MYPRGILCTFEKAGQALHSLDCQNRLFGLAGIEFGVFHVVVAEDVHELAGRGAAFGEHLAERLAQAVQGAALFETCGVRPVGHAAGQRFRRERLAVLGDQDGVAALLGGVEGGGQERRLGDEERLAALLLAEIEAAHDARLAADRNRARHALRPLERRDVAAAVAEPECDAEDEVRRRAGRPSLEELFHLGRPPGAPADIGWPPFEAVRGIGVDPFLVERRIDHLADRGEEMLRLVRRVGIVGEDALEVPPAQILDWRLAPLHAGARRDLLVEEGLGQHLVLRLRRRRVALPLGALLDDRPCLAERTRPDAAPEVDNLRLVALAAGNGSLVGRLEIVIAWPAGQRHRLAAPPEPEALLAVAIGEGCDAGIVGESRHKAMVGRRLVGGKFLSDIGTESLNGLGAKHALVLSLVWKVHYCKVKAADYG